MPIPIIITRAIHVWLCISSRLLGLDNKLDRTDTFLQLLQPFRNARKSARDDLNIVRLKKSSAPQFLTSAQEKAP